MRESLLPLHRAGYPERKAFKKAVVSFTYEITDMGVDHRMVKVEDDSTRQDSTRQDSNKDPEPSSQEEASDIEEIVAE